MHVRRDEGVVGVVGHGVVAAHVPVVSAAAHLGDAGALVAEGGKLDGRAVRRGGAPAEGAQFL